MLACLALILVTNITNLITYTATDANNATYCFMTNNLTVATSLIATLMRVFIPFGIMIALNFLVIYRLKQSKVRVSVSNVIQIASQTRRQFSRQLTKKEFRFTVSTLIIDVIFSFFYFPLGVAYVIVICTIFNASIFSDPLSNAIFILCSNVSQLLALAHTSVLFFIFLVFNRIFRAELVVLLRLNRFFPHLTSEQTTPNNQ